LVFKKNATFSPKMRKWAKIVIITLAPNLTCISFLFEMQSRHGPMWHFISCQEMGTPFSMSALSQPIASSELEIE
jgi:hypothetical protein